MEAIGQDVRFALRSLLKRPGFSAAVILTLALGIGANTAIFSFVNAILLRPLPYRDADRLVRIESVRGAEAGRISMLELRDLKEQSSAIEEIAAFRPGAQYNFSSGGAPEEVAATLSTRNLFDVLGVTMLHGQSWPESYDLERNFGVVLTYELWQRRFGGDPNVLGQKITLDAAPFYTIFGVLPAGIKFPDNVQMFRSIAISDRLPDYKNRSARNVYALARLRKGVSYENARLELTAFSQRLQQTYPDLNAGLSFRLTPLTEFYVGNVRPYLWLLASAVGFVLLIACGNVLNLLLSRALAREREIAIRTALGAGRGRLISQLLTESVVLALLGGGIGVALAYWWVKVIAGMIGIELPPWMTIEIDGPVLLFTLAVSIITGLLSGIVPALRASNPNLNELLKEGGRGSAGGGHQGLRRALVIAEIALALVLLSGAGLMVRSFWRLQSIDLGFNPDRLLTLRVALPWRKFNDEQGPARIKLFYQQTLEKMAALPGVTAAAATSNLPLSGESETGKIAITVEGQSVDEQHRNPYVNEMLVSPNYFQTMGIQVLMGRYLNEFDVETTERVSVISERLAGRIWPGKDPIGKRLKAGSPSSTSTWSTVIGVVKNVKHEQVAGEGGLDLYTSYRQVPDANMYLLLRTNGEPGVLTEAATRVIWAMDPEQSAFSVMTMEQRISDTIWQRRMSGALFAIFALLALALSGVGIYGVMSYAVSQRTREIGVRMALGARPRDILKIVLGEVLRMMLIGGLIGVIGAMTLARAIAGLLYGVRATDPITFLAVSLLLGAVAMLAGFLPARRAARTSPIEALRRE
jgi:putative ABC transport system permease protein